MVKTGQTAFPIKLTKARLVQEKSIRDGELIFYVRHVVDELERFYPDEYKLLEALATDDYATFQEATKLGDRAAHLFRYGVVSNPDYPYVTYHVLRDYVALENARREGRKWKYRLVAASERDGFIKVRMRAVIDDLRNLERLIKAKKKPVLFGANSFPEAERLLAIATPFDADTLGAALSILNRCFVESIEAYGKSLHKDKYFWDTVNNNYPSLHRALHRIKTYRHNSHHLQLAPEVEKSLRAFLEQDLDDSLAASDEKYWALFQRCLDGLFHAIQRETSRLELEGRPSQ